MLPSSHNWTFRWLTSWDEVANPVFLAEWHGWMDRDPGAHVFFHPALVRAWTETYSVLRCVVPRFVVAEREGLTVFLPLVLDRGGWKDAWLKVLQPVGPNEYDYHDPIVAAGSGASFVVRRSSLAENQTSGGNEEWLSVYWRALFEEVEKRREEFDLFCIPRVRGAGRGKGVGVQGSGRNGASHRESSILNPETLNPVASDQGSGFSPEADQPSADRFQPVEKAPFIDLSKYPSFEAFMASRSGNLRQGIKRKQRRLAEQGELKFKVYAPNETAQALEALTGFRKNHEIRWPRAYRAPGLFENLIKHALPEGLLHLSVIQCGGRTVSWHFGFVHKKRFYWYVPVYDNSFSRLSPGFLHISRLVEECYRLGLTCFDLLRGEERYKLELTDHFVPLCRCEMSSRRCGSRIREAGYHLLRGAARVVGR